MDIVAAGNSRIEYADANEKLLTICEALRAGGEKSKACLEGLPGLAQAISDSFPGWLSHGMVSGRDVDPDGYPILGDAEIGSAGSAAIQRLLNVLRESPTGGGFGDANDSLREAVWDVLECAF